MCKKERLAEVIAIAPVDEHVNPSYGGFQIQPFPVGGSCVEHQKATRITYFSSHWEVSKSCLTATKQQLSLASIRRPCSEWPAPERFLVFRGPLEISGINSERMAGFEARELNQEFRRIALDSA